MNESGESYDISSLKPVGMESTLESGGVYGFFSLDAITMVDYGQPKPDFSTIILAEILNEGNYSTVYGGYLLDEHDKKVHEVVVKLGELEQMQREAENYARLRNTQGRVIPRMFGYWEAQPEEIEKPWGCLVIERFGDRLTTFRYLEFWERAVLLNHLRDIHNQGLVHNDFHPRNVLQKDKEFRLIDLEDLTPHGCYECEVDFTMCCQQDDGEKEIWRTCAQMLGKVKSLAFGGFNRVRLDGYSFRRTQNLPSHKMISALFPQCIWAQYRQNAALEEFISQYYQRIYQKMVDLGLEDRKESVARLGKEAPQIVSDLKAEFSSRLELKPCCGTKHPNGLGYMSVWPVPTGVEVL